MTDERLIEILSRGTGLGASDLHIHAEAPIGVRINGELQLKGKPIPAAATEVMLLSLLNEHQRARFDATGEVDFSFDEPTVGRFRAIVFRQARGIDGVFRTVPASPPTFSDLRLPDQVSELTAFRDGLVLVAGPAGSGKSSTLAAMVDSMNRRRTDHLLMVEDPTEYLHPSRTSIVNQRQVKKHTESYPNALRAALREDPDVIVLGEMRDRETIALGLTAAETGHLVMSTLNTSTAIQTLDRLVHAFPPQEQTRIRTALSQAIRAVICQKLLPTIDGKSRVAAFEILIATPAVSQLIRDGETLQIRSMMQLGGAQGMCLFDQSLTGLVRQGLVSVAVATRLASDPERFREEL